MTFVSVIAAAGCGGDVDIFGHEDADGDAADSPADTTTDAPDLPDLPGWCPPGWPDPGAACTVEGTRCEYGSETCCGLTHPSYVCQCSGGSFGCYYTDACMGAPMGCSCGEDEDCEYGFGRAWCVDGTCVPCDDSGRTCELWCEHGFVPERNGCQPCACAEPPCERFGEGYCTCDAPCGDPGAVCEAGLGRCIPDFCSVADCGPGFTCDQLRGCVPGECSEDSGCRLIYSSCGCQAVVAGDPREILDPCDYDGGESCAHNSCDVDGVLAVCRWGLCTEQWGAGCGG